MAREIFTYVLRDMTAPEGGFYSAEDADSEGEEGKFYVWTPEEIREVLGEETGRLFCECYDVTEEGNFEGKNILHRIDISLSSVAARHGMSEEELERILEEARGKLFRARERRVRPHRDDKILTSWNALMIAALARGARVLGDEGYADAAEKAARFILRRMRREDGRLLARYRDGEAAILAFLDDYAFLAWGLMELYEATLRIDYLRQAADLTREMIDLFGDKEEGGFFFYGADGEELLTRPKEIYDGATPSGNSVAAYNLIRLARLLADPRLEEEAEAAASGLCRHDPAGADGPHLFSDGGAVRPGHDPGDRRSRRSKTGGHPAGCWRWLGARFCPMRYGFTAPKDPEAVEVEKLIPYVREHRTLGRKSRCLRLRKLCLPGAGDGTRRHWLSSWKHGGKHVVHEGLSPESLAADGMFAIRFPGRKPGFSLPFRDQSDPASSFQIRKGSRYPFDGDGLKGNRTVFPAASGCPDDSGRGRRDNRPAAIPGWNRPHRRL